MGMAHLDDGDLKAIKNLIEVTIDEKYLVTKEHMSHLLTKDEFYEQTVKNLKRLSDVEDGKDVLVSRVKNHDDRIRNLETKVGIQTL